MHRISKWILKLLGFKVTGWDPLTLSKYVVIVMYHTSNWDFPLGLLVRSAMEWDIKFVGKHTLFKWPFGGILRSMGGYPVNRSKSINYVESVAEIFAANDTFRVCITPEGTRSKVDRLKTGFYYIAKAAEVPIVMVAFDFKGREVRISQPVDSQLEYHEVYEKMRVYFKDVGAFIPANSYDFNENIKHPAKEG